MNFSLVGEIQKCYEVWLAGMFFLSVVQIGMALSQVTAEAVNIRLTF